MGQGKEKMTDKEVKAMNQYMARWLWPKAFKTQVYPSIPQFSRNMREGIRLLEAFMGNWRLMKAGDEKMAMAISKVAKETMEELDAEQITM